MKKKKRKIAKKKNLGGKGTSVTTIENRELDIVFSKAISFHQAGQLAEAEELYRQVLAISPDYVAALSNMGLAIWNQGRFDEAEDIFRRALDLAPGISQIHNNLGSLLIGQRRFDEAEHCFIKALKADPANAEAHNNLGLVLRELGRLEESGRAILAAIKVKPDYFEAMNNLGGVRLAQGQPEEAVIHFKKAIKIKPDYVEALYNLGICYKELGLYSESEENYRQAIRLRPNYVEAHNNLGILLADKGDFSEAENYYRKALENDPQHFRALTNLGELFEKTNRLIEAKEAALEALKINPDELTAVRLLATMLRREGKHEEALAQLVGIDLEQCGVDRAVEIHHELGMIHERLDDSEKAFGHFSEAQKLQGLTVEGKRADKNRYLADINKLDKFFTREIVAEWDQDQSGRAAENPVFIVGFPRSGTTLIDQLINSHPVFNVAEETAALDVVMDRLTVRRGGYPEALSGLSEAELQDLRKDYLSDIHKFLGKSEDQRGMRVVDKYPLHIAHLGLIYKLFPKAKIIVAIRHPNDVCLSNFMQLFKPNDAMANFTNLKDAAVCYDKVMSLWLKYEKIIPLDYYKIRYEDLVADFDQEVKSLLDFLDVEWDERISKFYEHARGRAKIYTPSYQQVTEPIYQRAVYRWQKYEKHFDNEIMDILVPYIKEFGYYEE